VHGEAYQWVAEHADYRSGISVLDIGGRNINGNTRDCYPNADSVTVVDILPGDGVDIVTNAATWIPDREYDLVVCTEVFEHAEEWRDICKTIYAALKPDAWVILTMAGPGRDAHSGHDGQFRLMPGEYYGNVDPMELDDCLNDCGFDDVLVDVRTSPADVRAVARKPHGDVRGPRSDS
jgi:Methyltransferase domain